MLTRAAGRHLVSCTSVLASAFVCLQLSAQPTLRSIPSLSEQGEELTVRHVSPQTGYVTFASTPGRGILLPVAADSPAETRARAFVEGYGKAFGLAAPSDVRLLRQSPADLLGVEHVRLQQLHRGVPVTGGEILVHLKGARVLVANGHILHDLPADVTPTISRSNAQLHARQAMEKHRPDQAIGALYSEPRLEIFNRILLSDVGTHRSALAWFVEATSSSMRELIWVDARTGALLLHFNQLTDAKNRMVYTAGHTSTLPGTLVRSEGDPATGDADQDDAFTHMGQTYDYYATSHGRDSFDDAGGTIIASADYCEPANCPTYSNAFWNGSQLVFGDGFPTDDVVGHEFTHAITERTSNLFYYVQSGALNESYSDIFGETIDLMNGTGNDAPEVRWQIAEDTPIGAFRDMMTPNNFSNPAKMSDANYFVCSDRAWSDSSDGGGVHTNSGVPNHAYALMVDGGTYNSQTIAGIGLTKAALIQFRALTVYLTSGSGFIDNYNALNQSCTDLIGTSGITSGDCTQVTKALLAVEMNSTWACAGATPAPARCPSGIPFYSTFEGFETGLGAWTATNDTGSWLWATGFAKTGLNMAWGEDLQQVSNHNLALTNAVTIPAGGRLFFDHAFEFESYNSVDNYDGGVVEYSTDGGTVWVDAASLIDGGMTYNGVVHACCSNPLANQSAFVRSSFGYTGSRLNLSSLAGQNAKFRFRIGTDFSIMSLGWLVDNVSIYSCVSNAFTDNPLVAQSTIIKKVHITELRARIDSVRLGNGLSSFAWTDPVLSIGTTPAKAVHLTELRTAINQVYTAMNRPAPAYTDPGLGIGTGVKAAHLAELRAAVIAIE